MKEIKLSGKVGAGLVTLVNNEDYEKVNQYRWYVGKNRHTYYVSSHINGKTVQLHRFILGLNNPKVCVDHINGDGLDNRKCNLRIATNRQNQHNSQARITMNGKPTSSKFKGVYWNKKDRKWMALGTTNNKRVYLGNFDIETEAAQAYNKFAKENYGEFARLNSFKATK